MKISNIHIKYLIPYFLVLFINKNAFPQETNSYVSGIVKSERNEILSGANVTVIHEPTQNLYSTQTRRNGYFNFSNLKPGGPYSILISFSGFDLLKKTRLYLDFNSSGHFLDLFVNESVAFILKEKSILLKEIILNATYHSETKTGTETNINNQLLNSIPSISRNLQDFVKLVPQSKVNGDGMMSLAGQNNKFNAFFIDGANNNDILGIALSGTNGGQTNTPPISINALEEIKVMLAPYNVQYSNFTGGSINAITKSGTNTIKSSAWHLFRNEKMAGRSPVSVESNNTVSSYKYPRLPEFLNQTTGVWLSGPFIKNKLFYFILAENQFEHRPQPFNLSEYRGNSSRSQLLLLADSIKSKYNYDPGTFLESKEQVRATRTLLKIDWNQSVKNKFTLTYRYNIAERQAPQIPNSGTIIRYQNNGFILPSRTHTGTFEWKSFFKNDFNNRFLFTYTNQLDDRRWIGQPFPSVSISDGPGTIFFGSNNISQLTRFQASDVTLLNTLRFIKGYHNFTAGFDFNYSKLNDLIIPTFFGFYRYRNINDFISGFPAFRYQRRFSLVDNPVNDQTNAMASYKTQRLGIFINDELQINPVLKLNFGFRLDGNSIFASFEKDHFFNDTASFFISKYYNLEEALVGKTMKTHWQISPRFGFVYLFPENNLTLRGGAGIFAGHILNIWISNLLNSSIGSLDINPQSFGLNFNPDPYRQPDFQSLGINPGSSKGELAIFSRDYKYPTIFRTSFTAEKKLDYKWVITFEAIMTKNIHETKYTNVNLLPPSLKTLLPDSRIIFSINNVPDRVPLYPNMINPYNNIILQTNNKGKKGYAYSFSSMVNKSIIEHYTINAGYTFGHATALFEPTGTAGPVSEQWRQNETINGKNFSGLSNSDFDYGHRIFAYLLKYFNYSGKKTVTKISLFYNGQSGSRFSYVYDGSMINDNGNRENFDLIYIPTKADLITMEFITNNVNGNIYSADQQKIFLNTFIENDKYLKKHRGQFAERNGARLPFIHTIDIRIQQDFKIKKKGKEIRLSIIYDVFNFTNMLNKKWGRIYFLSFDNYTLIRFAGYASNSGLTPQYQFTPFNGKPYSIQQSTAPGSSARWISQLGFKLNFN